jgi:hypothetical protein
MMRYSILFIDKHAQYILATSREWRPKGAPTTDEKLL